MVFSRYIHLLTLVAGTLFFCLACAPGCTNSDTAIDTSLTEPDSLAERPAFTAAEVASIRKASDIDARAMAIPGVISIGTAGTNEDAWIQVLCQDDSLAARAMHALGAELNGVPIRFDVSDSLTTHPRDPVRQH